MLWPFNRRVAGPVALTASVVIATSLAATSSEENRLYVFPNASGALATWRIGGAPIDQYGPFFQPLAMHSRSCSSCHRPGQGWTISAEEVRSRFEATKGLDPIFRTIDGSDCNQGVNTSTLAGRRTAYSLLLSRALVRVVLPVPKNADFEVIGVKNAYGCNDQAVLSIYRRPLPTTNLRFASTLMWDGRGSSREAGTQPITVATNPSDLIADLAHQALDASSRHAHADQPITSKQQKSIVDFEMSLATAQVVDKQAGSLDDAGAKGGPLILAKETTPGFFLGINDPQPGDLHRVKVEDAVRLFDAWSPLPYGRVYTDMKAASDSKSEKRASISRGQVLFDQRPFDIKNVAGLNDALHLTSITGACGTCHNTPNVGNHSSGRMMDTGVGDPNGPLIVDYLPQITLRNKSTQELRTITDPARALITGRWKDVGQVKVPSLRGLAARAPYFHNGSAATLSDVIDFYEKRFHPGFTSREKEDLVAFLGVL